MSIVCLSQTPDQLSVAYSPSSPTYMQAYDSYPSWKQLSRGCSSAMAVLALSVGTFSSSEMFALGELSALALRAWEAFHFSGARCADAPPSNQQYFVM